jgi:aminotransferase in exopolysaccharide biosynthesis
VITQPLTFIATANAISYCRANPVFIDVDRDTMGLSPGKLADFLSRFATYDTKQKKCINRQTSRPIAAVVPMHTFGNPCRIDEIVEIAGRYHIPVVEDAAESLGTTYKNRHTGTFGSIGVLSFNGNKIITTGGGGMILTGDPGIARMAKHLTTQAKVPHPWEFVHDAVGYNFRLPNINAALGVAQIEMLDTFISGKRKTAATYSNFFRNSDILFNREIDHSRSNCWLNAIVLGSREERDAFLSATNNRGIKTRPVWTLMNKLPMYSRCQAADLVHACDLEDRVVNLPSSYIKS